MELMFSKIARNDITSISITTIPRKPCLDERVYFVFIKYLYTWRETTKLVLIVRYPSKNVPLK